MLLGGVGAYADSHLILQEVRANLRQWAEGAELRRGESLVSETKILRVDVTRDEPPQWSNEGASHAYNGWLLDLPRTLTDYLESSAPGIRRQTEGA